MALRDAHGTAGGIGLLPPALGACFALSSTTLIAFSVVSPDVVAELQLSYGQAGVIAAAYMLGYGLFQIPVSLAGVLFGSGRVLFGATLLMAASSLLPCLFDGFVLWLIARLLAGIAAGAVLPLGLHLLTHALSGPRLVRGIGIFVAGWGIGMTVAMLGAAPLLQAAGWRQVMVATTLFGLFVAAFLRWGLPPDSPAGEHGLSPTLALRELIRVRALNLMGVVNAAGTTIMVCIPSWLPLYLTGTFDTPAALASAYLSPVGIGVALGGWLGGALTNRLGWRPVVVGSLLASSVLTLVIALPSSALPVAGLGILIGLVGMLFPAPIQSLFPQVVQQESTAIAAAYYNTIGFLGAFGASLAFGYLVDFAGSFTPGWVGLAAVPLLGVAAALALRIAPLART
jgi:predicted MFS family arabinose efflux permease